MGLTAWIWVAAGILLLILSMVIFAPGKKRVSKPSDKKPAKQSWFNKIQEKSRAWLTSPLGTLGVIVGLGGAIFFGIWLWDEFQDSSHLNPGTMTYDGTNIVVSKLPKNGDLSKLPYYQTPGSGEPLRFGTPQNVELYVVVLMKNDQGELVPSTSHEPVRYHGETLTKCSVEKYALFLGRNSRVKQTTIVAHVDTRGKTCNQLNGKLVQRSY